MIESARRRILETLADGAAVLDVGGWAVPFPRADWVLDLAPYETRGEWGYDGDPATERFSAATWVQRDMCDRHPWPFADKQFDFAICSHTLEDVRDPVFVCSELVRVARAGYIEVPSRLWEQSWGAQGDWVGLSHHHWLVDVDAERAHVDFVFKTHAIHKPGPDSFPAGFFDTLTEDQKIQSLWWRDAFTFRERVFFDAAELHEYLRAVVREHPFEPERRSRAPWRR